MSYPLFGCESHDPAEVAAGLEGFADTAREELEERGALLNAADRRRGWRIVWYLRQATLLLRGEPDEMTISDTKCSKERMTALCDGDESQTGQYMSAAAELAVRMGWTLDDLVGEMQEQDQ